MVRYGDGEIWFGCLVYGPDLWIGLDCGDVEIWFGSLVMVRLS